MPSNKAFQRRIQILDQCLRRRQKIWTANTLLDAMNEHLESNGYPQISIRTLYADLRYLQDDLDAPVEKYQQGKEVCYRYDDPGYSLVNTPISYVEKELLRKMLEYVKAHNLPIQADLEAMLERHDVFSEPIQFRFESKSKKSELSELRDKSVSYSIKMKIPSDDDPLNKLVLRMAGDDFSAYRQVFWQWVEAGT